MTDTYAENIIDFLQSRGNEEADATLGESDSLFESGLIDSLGFVEFVTFIEQKYGLELSAMDLVTENFDTIKSIVQLIEARTRGATAT